MFHGQGNDAQVSGIVVGTPVVVLQGVVVEHGVVVGQGVCVGAGVVVKITQQYAIEHWPEKAVHTRFAGLGL